MTKEDYDQQLKELKEKFEDDKKTLMRTYAFSKKKYNIGDMLEDSMG